MVSIINKCLSIIFCICLLVVGCENPTEPDPNQPPVVNMVAIQANSLEEVYENSTYSLIVDASDADGDALSYGWSVDRGSLRSSSGREVYWDTPSAGGESRIRATVTVTASDSKATTSRGFYFYVYEIPNSPPSVSISSGPSGSTSNRSPSFSWSGYDSDGNVTGYYYDLDDSSPDRWTTGTSISFTNLSYGSHTFYVKAKDNDGDYSDIASRSFVIEEEQETYGTVVFHNEANESILCYVNGYYQGLVSMGGTYTVTRVPTGSVVLSGLGYDSGDTYGPATFDLSDGETLHVYFRNTRVQGPSLEKGVNRYFNIEQESSASRVYHQDRD